MRHTWGNRLGRIAACLLLLGGPFIGSAAYRMASRYERERLHGLFGEYLAEQTALLQREFHAIAEELYRMRLLFNVDDELRRAQFQALAGEALTLHPAIRALEWVPCVSGKERVAFESQARREGLEGYRIKVRVPGGDMAAAPPKAEYRPLLYVEPLEANSPAVGFDLSSEEPGREALARAGAGRNLVVTHRFDLIRDAGSSREFLALFPVYRRSPAAVRSGSSELKGFVLLVFGTQEVLARTLLSGQQGFSARMAFQLSETDAGGKPIVVETSADWDERRAAEWEACVQRIELGDRRWRLAGQPTEKFLSAHRGLTPWVAGLGAFVLWEPLAGLLLFAGWWSQGLVRRRQERMLSAVTGQLTEGVVVADTRGKFLLFNKVAERIIGLGLRDEDPAMWPSVYGCYLADGKTLYKPDQLPLARAISGEEVREEEMFIRNPNVPRGVWISISGAPLLDEHGALVGGTVAFRDITERKAHQETLQRLSSAVEQTADVVFITDRNGTIEYVNPAFEAVTGYSPREALGRSPRILKSGVHGAKHYEALWKTVLAGEVYRSTGINRKKNGELFHAEQTITPMKDPQGQVTHFVSVIKDVTERIKTERREIEMHYASLVQKRLYPQQSPRLEGLDVAGAVFSAEATCGDYFDFLSMPNNTVGIVVGDVCGHGLGPALIMAETRAYLRSLSRSGSDLCEIFGTINRALQADLDDNCYVTLLAACIDVSTGDLVYANAGHPPGYLLDRAGRVKAVLESSGFPLGIFPGTGSWSRERLLLEPGEIVVLFTDGIIESQAEDGTFFEADGVLDAVRAHRHEPAGQIVQRIHQAVLAFAPGATQNDDFTIVVCKRDLDPPIRQDAQ